MEDKVLVSLDGQELLDDDVNLTAEEAALADDRVLAQLLRLPEFDGAAVYKAVIPFSGNKNSSGIYPVATPNAGQVQSSASANASVFVNPLRAVVGSRVASGTSVRKNFDDTRSAIALGASQAAQAVQLAATSSNHRWDLIYARVDVDINGPSVDRFVKDASDVVTLQNFAVLRRTTVTIGKVQGVEAGPPTRPALPADSGSSYYIPLAYVLLTHPHTLTTTIDRRAIHEVYPVYPISPSLGVSSVAPANHLHKVGGSLIVTPGGIDFVPGTPPIRPPPYLPAGMVGSVTRLISMFWNGGTQYPAVNTTKILDDSIDWRNRLFRWHAMVGETSTGYKLAWDPTAGGTDTPTPGTDSQTTGHQAIGMGQSCYDDGTGVAGFAGGIVARLQNAFLTEMAASAVIIVYVDLSTGELKANVANVNPSCALFLWLDASAPFGNE